MMVENNNAICSICDNGYHICLSCNDSMKLHPWKMYCCSADCYKIFQVVRGFSTGVYTKDEFKSKLQNIDLSNLENYREHIKDLIKDALKENEVIKTESSIAEEVATEEVIVKKPVYSRKRNYKAEVE